MKNILSKGQQLQHCSSIRFNFFIFKSLCSMSYHKHVNSWKLATDSWHACKGIGLQIKHVM